MTVAELKRRLTPGTRLHVTNHVIPADSREAEVVKATTIDFYLTHPRAGERGSLVRWPRAAYLIENPDGSVTILGAGVPGHPPARYIPDQPLLTLRWL